MFENMDQENFDSRNANNAARKVHRGNKGDAIYIDYDLPVDNKVFPCVEPWGRDWDKRQEFLEQVKQAFSTKPSMSGVIHGRRLIKLGKRGFRCSYFPSKKNAVGNLQSVNIPMESRVESAFALALERDPNVKAYRTQAIELAVPGGTVFPDFLVVDCAGRLHVRDVKADKRYISARMKQRIEHLTVMLGRWGVNYAVVDSYELPDGPKLKNLYWMNQKINAYPGSCQIKAFLELDFDRSTYGQLKALCKAKDMDESIVTYLLFIGKLNTDWQNIIDDDSGVWL